MINTYFGYFYTFFRNFSQMHENPQRNNHSNRITEISNAEISPQTTRVQNIQIFTLNIWIQISPKLGACRK